MALALTALVCLLAFVATAKAEIVHFQEAFSPINGTGDAVLQKPFAIAIDEATGNVFVGETDGRNQVSILGAQGGAPVDLLSPFTVTGFNASGTNQFRAGAVAYDDDPSSPGFGNLYIPDTVAGNVARKVRIYTRNLVTERYEQTGELVPDAIVSAFPRPYGVAIDPDGDVWVADINEKAVIKFDPTTGDELMRIDMRPTFPHTASSNTGQPEQIAFSAAGDLFVMEAPRFAPFPRVVKWVADGTGEIDPSDEPLLVPNTSGAWGMALDRSENSLYISFSDHVDQYDVDTLTKVGEFGRGVLVGARGVAVNETNGRVYVADNGSVPKSVVVYGPSVRTAVVEASPATGIGTSAATMNGSVSAQGSPLSFCRFEYGTSDEYGETAPCPGIIPANMSSHPVSVALSGLDPNTTYHYRLVAENASGVVSRTADVTFTTRGKPTVSHTLPIWVDRETAKVGAYVNPSGFATNYRFEWGPTDAYGQSVPADFEPSIPAGTERVKVIANLSGLSAETAYHFRVVATNASGTTYGPDQRFETLNSCGFILDRCLELVSSGDKGFTGTPGSQLVGDGRFYQAAAEGSSVVFPVLFGYADATTGGEVIYRSERGDAGWAYEQVSPETPAPSQPTGTGFQSRVLGFSRDMSCFAFLSSHLLTPDTPRSTVEAGAVNLFLRDRDGETRVVSSRPMEGQPLNTWNSTKVVGISDDCGKVVFHNDYRYAGLAGTGDYRLYEWERSSGELRAISEVPGPSGAQVVAVNPGTAATGFAPGSLEGLQPGSGSAWRSGNRFNALSADGARVFFTGQRKLGDGPAGAAEVDKMAVFARVDGSESVDISQSQTATPNAGALYQLASRDGDKVLFTANYGLTEAPDPAWPTSCDHSSRTGSGCDLYEYDFSRPDGERLVNLSRVAGVANAGGAGVVGAVAASEDATKVYFLARGRLVPGTGPSEAQNLANNTYSLYLRSEDGVQFVGAVSASDAVYLLVSDNMNAEGSWLAQATASGSHLVFPAKADVTGDDPSAAQQAYRFDAETGRTVCVSCLRDGGEPVIVGEDRVLQLVYKRGKQPRAITDDGRSIFFIKRDILAPGAVEGRRNLYEWRDGQISYLGSSYRGEALPPGIGPDGARFAANTDIELVGASADGKDVYFTTNDPLTWQDHNDRLDVYSARQGGGFAEPPPPPDPCVGEACQGPLAAAPPAWDIASFSFIGDGNASPGARSALGVGRPSMRAIRRAARTGRLAVAVRTDRAGVVRVLARAKIGKRIRRVAGESVRVRKAGRARLTLRLNRTARARLESGRSLNLSIEVRSPGARSRSIGVRLPGGKS